MVAVVKVAHTPFFRSVSFGRRRRCWQRVVIVGVVCLLLQGGIGSAIAQTPESPVPETAAPAEGYSADSAPERPDEAPVMLDGEPLFTVRDIETTDSAAARAERISERIEALARDQAIAVDEIAMVATELGPVLFYEDLLLFGVSEEDAANTGLTPEMLAEQYLSQLRAGIEDYRSQRSAEYLIRAGLITLACTVALVVAIVVLANVMPQFYRWLDRQQGRWIPNFRLQNFELISSQQLTGIVQFFTQILLFLLIASLILFYLSYVLSLFPQTRYLGQEVFGYVWAAVLIVWNGLVGFLPNLLAIVLIAFVTSLVLRFTRWIFANIRRGRLRLQGFYPEWAAPTFRLMQFLIISFALAVIFPYLPGANSPAFQGVSIFVGLLVSLGASGVIYGIVAGFVLVYTRAFTEGDRIRFDDIEGFVVEKSLFVTRIRTVEDALVSVPNTSLLTGKITNYTALLREQKTPLTVKTTITLGYDVPWKLVHQTLIAAALATPDILEEPAPRVWQTSLDDFYVSYQVRAATLCPDKLGEIYSVLHQNLQDYCNAADIEILSPHYGAMRDGNQTTIPADYLPADYTPPHWNLATPWQSAPGQRSPGQ